MSRIVHLGHGRTVAAEQPAFIDPTVARPRRASIPEIKRQSLRRLKPAYELPKPEGPVRFVPGPLLAMRKGQCRWPLDGGLFCGARASDGSSYCQPHDDLAHGRLSQEAAE